MRSLVLLMIPACWSGQPATATTVAPPAAPTGTCTIRERDATPMDPIALAIEGETFAHLYDALDLDLTITGAESTQQRIETTTYVFERGLDLDALRVRPRDRSKLHDGWLDVQTAVVRKAVGATAQLEVELPEGLMPRTVDVPTACSELTIVGAEDEEPEGDVVVVVKPTPLLRTPHGAVLARFVPSDDHQITVTVLERRGDHLRVAIRGPNEAIGWVAKSATELQGLGGGGYGIGGFGGRSPRMMSCQDPVPLYVRSPSGKVVRVGLLKQEQAVLPVVDPKSGVEEVGVKLGGTLTPFFRASDLAECLY